MALGSFIIAVITMIRAIFEYIVAQNKAAGADNKIVKALECVIRYILWCLDKYIKFITKNAYIQIALRSKNFCASAWESFYLLIRHAGRFGAAEMIGFIMMFLGKATIMGTSAWITLVFIQFEYPDVQQPLLPAGIIAAVAYLVGSLFLSIFSFSCTAILHSFILDEDTGVSEYTPDCLQAFLDENDRQKAISSSPKK